MVAAAVESCPKCGTARREASRACTRCGLAYDRMDAFAAQRDAAVPDSVAAAWERAVAAWGESGRHDELLRAVAQHDAYAWAAAKYRDAKRARGYRDVALDEAIADRQLERLRKAAEATLLASSRARDRTAPAPYRATVAILAMMVVAIVAGLLYARILGDNTSADRGTGVPAPAEHPRILQPLKK